MRRLPTAFAPDCVEFMAPFLAVPGEWKAYEVRGPSGADGEDMQLNYYAINVEAGAYCTFITEIQDEEQEESKCSVQMKYRDMIIDNVAAAGGDLAKMQAIGTRSILNEAARDMIDETFKLNKKDPTKQGSIRLASSEAKFNDCATVQPFASGHNCLVNKCGQNIGFAKTSAFVVFSGGLTPEEKENGIDSPAYHLVTLLETPDKEDIDSAVEADDGHKAKAGSVKDVIDLIGDAIAPLKDAKDDLDGDQRIRDAINVLNDAIAKLKSSKI